MSDVLSENRALRREVDRLRRQRLEDQRLWRRERMEAQRLRRQQHRAEAEQFRRSLDGQYRELLRVQVMMAVAIPILVVVARLTA